MKHRSYLIRYVCLVCVIVAALSFLSCSSVKNDAESPEPMLETDGLSDAPETEHNNVVTPQTPILRFDGATVRVLCEEDPLGSDLCFSDVSQSEYSRLAHERDKTIEQNHDLCISYETSPDIFSLFGRNFTSGDAPHVVYARGSGGMSELMLYGYLDDLKGHLNEDTLLSSGISADALRQLSIDGRIYMITGTPMRSSVSSTIAVGYNKSLLTDYGYDSDHIDRLVLDGAWTHDAMHSIAGVCSGTTIRMSEDSLYYLWQGMGATTVDKLPGDIPAISVYTPRNLFFFEHVHDYYSSAENGSDDNTLFVIDTIERIGEKLGSDASLAPLPTYSERSEYTCVMDFSGTYFTAMPNRVEDSRLAGCYLGALFSESVDSVYSETIREYSYGNEIMLDVILRSRYFDLLDMYGIGHIVRSAFAPSSPTSDFDELLCERAEFAERALEITLGQTVNNKQNR